MKIIYDTMLPREWYDRLGEHTLVPDTALYESNSLTDYEDAEVLTTNFYKPVRVDLLDRLPKLKLVTQFGVGYDNIDVHACSERGILVTNTPQPVIEPTAELCMTLILDIARRTAELDRGLRKDEIQFGLLRNLGHSVYGKTLGIIGMGNIGRAVARRAIACGMKIIYHNRHEIALPVLEQSHIQAQYTSMDELLKQADFVSLNLPYTQEVHHLIGERELKLMKKNAFLINTARGAHVDEKTLAQALREHWIAGAALDVYEHEPMIEEELKSLDNVLLVPHVGTGTWEGRKAMCDAMVDNIIAYSRKDFNSMTPVN
ncbi:MAG: NAD(P)-binding domain-containing protein [Paludibacteraceae bacterium]|nr:NAD(P)-binding domain-containing protein [Paludibacteraceae bacterium]MBQ9706240.1 NAD(P)-binding domain-containing protein [Paludibacteraceae bacterium]